MADSQPFNYDLDKISYSELNNDLKNTIKANLAHTRDKVIHVTQTDKNNWNLILDYPEATASKKGMMSAADKVKLDGIEKGANKYIHPKSGVKPGLYIQCMVDINGHVTEGFNPTKLNITSENSDKLGGYPAADYAKKVSPFFMGQPQVPTPEGDAPEHQIVNIDYLRHTYKPYVENKVTPQKGDNNLFWVGPNNCLNNNPTGKEWKPVFTEVSLFGKALNEDTELRTKPNDYSNFVKFIGRRKVSALGLKHIHSTSTQYATVWGLRANELDLAYELIFLDNYVYMRSGTGVVWNPETTLVGGSGPTVEKAVTYNSDNHIIAGDLEMWVGDI